MPRFLVDRAQGPVSLTLNASAIYNVARYPAGYFDQVNVSLQGKQIAFAPIFRHFSGQADRRAAERVPSGPWKRFLREQNGHRGSCQTSG